MSSMQGGLALIQTVVITDTELHIKVDPQNKRIWFGPEQLKEIM